MSLKKFEEMRTKMQRKHEEDMARLVEEEKKERQKRVGPLVSRYTNLFQDVVTKALNDRVDDLEATRFRKGEIRQRLEAAVALEVAALLAARESLESDDNEVGDSVKENVPSSPDATPSSDGFFDAGALDTLTNESAERP